MKIYTRTGDNGITSLYDGTRLPKHELVFDVLGGLDELSSAIGFVLVKTSDFDVIESESVFTFLRSLQRLLLDYGSILAHAENKIKIDSVFVEKIENIIDTLTEQLPSLTDFVLPGLGDDVYYHQCRVICRRVERRMCELNPDNTVLLKIMNRLSDLFFTLARYTTYLEGKLDITRNRNEPPEPQNYSYISRLIKLIF